MRQLDETILNAELEQKARKVIISSAAYYGLDVSIYKDIEFDLWCRDLHDGWEELCENTQWKLGGASLIRASGFHVNLRERDAAVMVKVLQEMGQYSYPVTANHMKHKTGFKYHPAASFRWDYSKRIQ